MNEIRDIFLNRGWLIMVRDLDIDPEDGLRRAGLPLEMLHQETSRLTVKDHFAMLAAVEEFADDPMLPIKLGQSASPEAFSAPIFAALCSSTLAVAASSRNLIPARLRRTQLVLPSVPRLVRRNSRIVPGRCPLKTSDADRVAHVSECHRRNSAEPLLRRLPRTVRHSSRKTRSSRGFAQQRERHPDSPYSTL